MDFYGQDSVEATIDRLTEEERKTSQLLVLLLIFKYLKFSTTPLTTIRILSGNQSLEIEGWQRLKRR